MDVRDNKNPIAIVGAGIGGLVAALAFKQRNIPVEVFERSSELQEVGAGVQISPNAMKVMRALGLEQALAEYSNEPLSFVGSNWRSGRELYRSPIKGVFSTQYGAGYSQVHRADLQRLLVSALADVPLHLGKSCEVIDNEPDRVVVGFKDGTRREFAAVVGADGIKSTVRNAVFGEEDPRFTGCMCWRGLVRVDALPKEQPELVSQNWLGPDGHIIHYHIRNRTMLNFVAVHESRAWVEESWSVPSSREELMSAYQGWHPSLHVLFARADRIYKWGLFDRDPLDRWSEGRVTLLGDAAHPMLPFFAQGAAQAIEDGYALAESVAIKPNNLELAFETYERVRRERATRIQLGARQRRFTVHMRSKWRQLRRDAIYKWQQFRDPLNNSYRPNWIYNFDVTNKRLYS